VRNEGTISAPGGTVVLAGSSVSNTGTIVANGGRVGMVAANAVSIDVEGDGLLFFQTSATEAKNRLAQLGRIQADGGTVEMRAAARGAFADTVLNMTGIVQAKTIGSRKGGSSSMAAARASSPFPARSTPPAWPAASAARVTVEGQRISSTTAASSTRREAPGGAIRRGDFHGTNRSPQRRSDRCGSRAVLRPTRSTRVAAHRRDLVRRPDAVPGQRQRPRRRARRRRRLRGLGKQSLAYDGKVDTRAPKGVTGTLLLDPTDITIDQTQADTLTVVNTAGVFTDPTASPSNIKASTLTGQLATTAVIVTRRRDPLTRWNGHDHDQERRRLGQRQQPDFQGPFDLTSTPASSFATRAPAA
jgi:hypothetical protein